MLAAEREQRHLGHLAEDGQGHQVLPIAAIYGANGSGKSNFVKAVAFARQLILDGIRANRPIPINPFKLGQKNHKESGFEFVFSHQEAQYSYGFRLNSEQITEEWLYSIPPQESQENLVFERQTSSEKVTEVEYGNKLKENGQEREQFLDFIAQGTRHNQLLLTEAVERNVKELIEVYAWLENSLILISAESENQGLGDSTLASDEFSGFLDAFLVNAGIGITSISLDKISLDQDEGFLRLPEHIRDSITEAFADLDQVPQSIQKTFDLGANSILFQENQLNLIRFKIHHRDQNGELVDFDLNEESDGTQRLIHLSPVLFEIQNRDDVVLILDELDRRLHPLVSKYFIKEVVESKKTGNQFIFTTHDTNLLDLDLLRRDEIWFVEKGEYGDSNLYSLIEFKIKPGLEIDKGYLNGRFGAIPFLGDLRRLGWLDKPSEST